MSDDAVYAVPPAVIFRAWTKAGDEDPRRRLMIKNSGRIGVSFKLALPQQFSFVAITGSCLAEACNSDGSGFTLLPGESTTLSLVLHRSMALTGEAQAELVVMMPGENLHVMLITLEYSEQPAAGDPLERRSKPAEGSQFVYNIGCPVSKPKDAEALAEKISRGVLTPAMCTEEDELNFYMQVVRDQQLLLQQQEEEQEQEQAHTLGVEDQFTSCTSSPIRDGEYYSTSHGRPQSSRAVPDSSGVRLVKVNGSESKPSTTNHLKTASSSSLKLRGAPCNDADELAFYQSLIAMPPSAEDSQAAARKALQDGTYFVLHDGTVCDSRGRSLGLAAEVLGGEYASSGAGEGTESNLALPSSDAAGPPQLEHEKRGGWTTCAGDKPRVPVERNTDMMSSLNIEGGSRHVRSAAASKHKALTDEQMQANWEALS